MEKGKIWRSVIAIILIVTLLLIGAVPALAIKGDSPANDNPNNLYLYQKDADAAWGIVWDGAWGKYNYSLSSTVITGPFNGHGLAPGTNYTLIEYDGWPNVTVIGSGVADASGDVHITGTVDVGTGGEVLDKYKIWLVLSSDINASGALAGWNPSQYLFEHNLIPN